MSGYFFFDDFLLLLEDFFDEDDLEPPFFDAAIVLTTFHAVRDLTVALTWRNAPDLSGIFAFWAGETRRDGD